MEVERNIECVGVRSEVDRIECDLKRADGTVETTHPEWLAACDGARSVVRHHVAVEFAGVTEELALCSGRREDDQRPTRRFNSPFNGPSRSRHDFPS